MASIEETGEGRGLPGQLGPLGCVRAPGRRAPSWTLGPAFSPRADRGPGRHKAVIGSAPPGTVSAARTIDAAVEITRPASKGGGATSRNQGPRRCSGGVRPVRRAGRASSSSGCRPFPSWRRRQMIWYRSAHDGPERFHYTEMLTVAPASAGSQALDSAPDASQPRARIERDASRPTWRGSSRSIARGSRTTSSSVSATAADSSSGPCAPGRRV